MLLKKFLTNKTINFTRATSVQQKTFAKNNLGFSTTTFPRTQFYPTSHSILVQNTHFKNNKQPRAFFGSSNFNEDYTNLFQFIRKNRFIPDYVDQVAYDSAKSRALLLAIQTGNQDAEIYRDPNCYLHLLHLMKTQQITYWQGITVFYYLMALMQFSEKQPIKALDQDTKDIREPELLKMFKDGCTTPVGEFYIRSFILNSSMFKIKIDEEEFTQYLLKQPLSEQMLIKVPHNRKYNYINMMAEILIHNVPFIIADAASYIDFKNYFVPSSAVMNYFLQHVSDASFKRQPVFGILGTSKLREMHEQKIHPIAFSAFHVNSNLSHADNYRCGYFLMALHDEGHTFWASLMSKADHDYMNNSFVPLLESLIKEANLIKDVAVSEKLRATIDVLYDYNLTPVKDFIDPNTRLTKYLTRIFSSPTKNKDRSLYSNAESPYGKLGQRLEDRIFYLLSKKYYEGLNKNQDVIVLGQVLKLTYAQAVIINPVYARTLQTIDALAKNALHCNKSGFFTALSESKSELLADEWRTKLEETLSILQKENNSNIWEHLIQSPHLLNKLAVESKFSVFEPYVSFNEFHKLKLIHWIQSKIIEIQNTGPQLKF